MREQRVGGRAANGCDVEHTDLRLRPVDTAETDRTASYPGAVAVSSQVVRQSSSTSFNARPGRRTLRARECDELLRNRRGVHDRITPVVEDDALREELGADAVAVAADRVELQSLRHRQLQSRCMPGSGRTGSRRVTLQRALLVERDLVGECSRALRRNRTAPSGSRHAPRPITIPDHRSRSSSTEALVCVRASSCVAVGDRSEPVDARSALASGSPPRG